MKFEEYYIKYLKRVNGWWKLIIIYVRRLQTKKNRYFSVKELKITNSYKLRWYHGKFVLIFITIFYKKGRLSVLDTKYNHQLVEEKSYYLMKIMLAKHLKT